MPTTLHTSAISAAFDSWTGSLEINHDGGGVQPVAEVYPGDSVASFLSRYARLLTLLSGVKYTARIDATGVVRIEVAGGFDFEVMVCTGEIAARTLLSFGESSNGIRLGTDRPLGVYIPEGGVNVTAGIGSSTAAMLGDGSGGASPMPTPDGGSVSLQGQDDGDLLEIETDAVGIFDVWAPDGKVWHRFAAPGWIRAYPGNITLGSGLATLTPDGGATNLMEVP